MSFRIEGCCQGIRCGAWLIDRNFGLVPIFDIRPSFLELDDGAAADEGPVFARVDTDVARRHRVGVRVAAELNDDGAGDREADGFLNRVGFDEGGPVGVSRQTGIGGERVGDGRGRVARHAIHQLDGEQRRHITGFQLFQLQLGKLGGGGYPGAIGLGEPAEKMRQHGRHSERCWRNLNRSRKWGQAHSGTDSRFRWESAGSLGSRDSTNPQSRRSSYIVSE